MSSNEKACEISVQELQMLSFRLITESMRIFASYREVGRNKLSKLAAASRIHSMIVDAIKMHPDISHLRELDEMLEQVQKNLTALEGELNQSKETDRLRSRYRGRTQNLTAERSP